MNWAKDTNKSFYRYVNWKRKVSESVPTIVSNVGKLATTDEGNSEVCNKFFA